MKLHSLKHDWFLWALAALAILIVFATLGCDVPHGHKGLRCPPAVSYEEGQVVRLRIGGTGQILAGYTDEYGEFYYIRVNTAQGPKRVRLYGYELEAVE